MINLYLYLERFNYMYIYIYHVFSLKDEFKHFEMDLNGYENINTLLEGDFLKEYSLSEEVFFFFFLLYNIKSYNGITFRKSGK
jgi:hypothetical protein